MKEARLKGTYGEISLCDVLVKVKTISGHQGLRVRIKFSDNKEFFLGFEHLN